MIILHKVRLVIFLIGFWNPISTIGVRSVSHQQAILTPAESLNLTILTLPGIELDSTGCGFFPYPGTPHPTPTHLTSDVSLKSRFLPTLWPVGYILEGPTNATQLFSSINLLESHTTQETRSSQIIGLLQNITQGTAKWKRCTGQGVVKWHRASRPLLAVPLSTTPPA